MKKQWLLLIVDYKLQSLTKNKKKCHMFVLDVISLVISILHVIVGLMLVEATRKAEVHLLNLVVLKQSKQTSINISEDIN